MADLRNLNYVPLCRLIADFSAVAHKSNRQHSLLSVGLVNDPVVAHSKFEETGEGPSEVFWFNGVKILGKPARLVQQTIGHHLVEFFKVPGRSGAKFDLIHLPFQAPAAGQFSRGNILALFLRILKIPQKAFSNFRSQSKTCVGITQNLAQRFLDDLADKRF